MHVGESQKWPTVCERCVAALEAIGAPAMGGEARGCGRGKFEKGWAVSGDSRFTGARDPRFKLLLISVAVFIADRLSKLWILKHIISGQEITIIPHFFHLSHVYNNGAAFSLFSDTPSPDKVRWMLIGFSLVAIAIVLFVFMKAGRRMNLTSIALALVLGGAIGNLYDRLAYRYVIDFLAFNFSTLSLSGFQRCRFLHCDWRRSAFD